jgi:peptidoglycan/xylan/chitin deacetylase (PgdA/CDA1 family)
VTPAVLDVLERAGARATFFALGAALDANAELGRAIAARHEIATHLYSHSSDACRTVGGFDEEVRRAFDVHRRVLGETPSRLRFPFGDSGVVRRSDIEKWGLADHRWTFSSEDSSAAGAREIVDHVVPRLHAGAVVLLHDGRGPNSTNAAIDRSATVSALPHILEAILRRGFRAVSLREMFADAVGRPAKHMQWPEWLEQPRGR